MATFRVGVGSFNINDGTVGIGTEGSGHGNLKVEGTARASVVDVVGGASTFTRYSGFSANQVSVNDRNFLSVYNTLDKNNRILELTGETQTTGDIIVDDRTVLKVGLGSTACVGSLEYVCVKNHFSVPTGGTNQRNSSVYVEGTIRYNTDLGTMEFFNGSEWRQFKYISDIQNSPGSRGRGIIHLGFDNPADLTDIHFVNINSKGNSQNFGDLSEARRLEGAASSETRGVFGGGQVSPSEKDTIDYITLAAGGTAIDFGNLGSTRTIHQAFSSSTRAVWGGSYNAPGFSNVMEYVEIGTLGNALDFGDAVNSGYSSMAVSSPTRGILAGGFGSSWFSSIDLFTIASKGDGKDFGDLTSQRRAGGRASNTVRGIFAGGAQGPGPAYISKIDYITIASEGNAVPFGDLTYSDTLYAVGTSNQTRGIFSMGFPASTTIDSVEIATTGDATDFGEISYDSTALYGGSAVSDSHGGLGGY